MKDNKAKIIGVTIILNIILFIVISLILNYLKLYIIDTSFLNKETNTIALALMLSITLTIISIYFGDYIKVTVFEVFKILKIEKNISKEIKDIIYYRDTFKEYSPMLLSKCMNKTIMLKDDIVAMFLYLEQKGFIEIKNYKIIEKDNKYEKMMNHERYFLDNYKKLFFKSKSKEKNKFNKKYYESLIVKDILELNLGELPVSKEESKIKFKISILGIFIGILIIFCTFKDFYVEPIKVSCYLILLMIQVVLYNNTEINYYFDKSRKLKTNFIRSKEGIKLAKELYALKKYISEYSNINNTKIEEIKLWESYTICTIMFDLKGNLDKEAKTIYEKITDKIPKEKYNKTEKRKIIDSISVIITTIFCLIVIFKINFDFKMKFFIIFLIIYLLATFSIMYADKE